MPARDSSVRIIAGAHKGHVLRFPDLPFCRPTMSTVRETLFHWLTPLLTPEMSCLDPFSGSGALGFEAASRGVHHVMMFEACKPLYQALLRNQTKLHVTDKTQIILGRMPGALKKLPEQVQFDMVFLDPPFDTDLAAQTVHTLIQQNRVKPITYLYLESDRHTSAPCLDPRWQIHREKCVGQARCQLLMGTF